MARLFACCFVCLGKSKFIVEHQVLIMKYVLCALVFSITNCFWKEILRHVSSRYTNCTVRVLYRHVNGLNLLSFCTFSVSPSSLPSPPQHACPLLLRLLLGSPYIPCCGRIGISFGTYKYHIIFGGETKATSLVYTTARGLLERWVYSFSLRYLVGTEASTALAVLKRCA